jgi:PPM family protein phosphatase
MHVNEQDLLKWISREIPKDSIHSLSQYHIVLATAKNHGADNQDALLFGLFYNPGVSETWSISILSDGVGSTASAKEAALLCNASLLSHLLRSDSDNPKEALLNAVLYANQIVAHTFRDSGASTVVALLKTPRATYVSSVGDSLVYLLSANGKPLRINEDDTIGNAFHKLAPNADQSQKSPWASHLAQYIGMGRDLEPHIYELDQTPDNVIVLASDGHATSDLSFIQQVFRNAPTLREFAQRMTLITRWRGTKDNASLIVLRQNEISANNEAATYFTLVADSDGSLHLPTHRNIVQESAPLTADEDNNTISTNILAESIQVNHKEAQKKKKTNTTRRKKTKDKPKSDNINLELEIRQEVSSSDADNP